MADPASHVSWMWRARIQPYRVSVVPCTEKPGCFRWVIHEAQTLRSEGSSYAFATEAGARASGESWRRAFKAGQDMA